LRLLTLLTCSSLVLLWMGASPPLFAQTAETAPVETVRPGLLWLLDADVGQGYDDSPLGTGRGGYFTEFNPILDLEQDRKHGFWSLNLQPMVQHFYGFSVADHVNELASTTDSWQMSRRWTLDLNGNYVHTSDPFFRSEGSFDAQPVSTTAVVAPNNAFIGPEAAFTDFAGSGTIDYQAGRYTQLTFGGDYFSYREDVEGLADTTSYTFRAGYGKMVRRGQTIGLLYSSQSFTVTDPGEQATVNSLLLSYKFEWKTGRQVEFFAGPQYSRVSATLSGFGPTPTALEANQNVLGFGAGATLSLVITKQNYLQLMGSRRVANGAAGTGVTIQDEAQLGFSREFSKRLSASVGGFYSQYQELGNLPVSLPNGWGAFNRVQFMIAPRSAISVEYDYFHQSQISNALAPLFSDNRAFVGYRYSFGSLRGRR
jgi:hypothetical protein